LVGDGLACVVLGFEETGEVWKRLAFLTLVILKEFDALKEGSTCEQLMGELRFVALALIVRPAVDLLVSVLSFVYRQAG
jgi:hypothetical protein